MKFVIQEHLHVYTYTCTLCSLTYLLSVSVCKNRVMACQQQHSDEPVCENSVPEASSSSGMLQIQYLYLATETADKLLVAFLSLFL